MTLTLRQIELLKLEKEKLLLQREELIKAKIDTASNHWEYEADGNIHHIFTEEVGNINKRINEIDFLLSSDLLSSEIETNINNNIINIGSEFEVELNFDGEVDTVTATLISKKVGTESSGEFISCESPLGKAIYKKCLNDVFSYELSNGFKVIGRVTSIGKQKTR